MTFFANFKPNDVLLTYFEPFDVFSTDVFFSKSVSYDIGLGVSFVAKMRKIVPHHNGAIIVCFSSVSMTFCEKNIIAQRKQANLKSYNLVSKR